MRVLVTGGVRSGKSAHAERLLDGAGAVTYVAPGPTTQEDSDPDWAARILAHQRRRPDTWTTLESRDLPGALGTPGPVLLDCLGTWLTGHLDSAGLWDAPSEVVRGAVRRQLAAAVQVLAERPRQPADSADRDVDLVLVTNEVGLGVVPEHRSGRLFRDLLGEVNQVIAGECDEVHLVVAGRVLIL
ncbi:bifunctional adenosylcobinamide kinase/adenosylcobinamide-phosphate guanylyltransferase [Marihabitans asiaticum]|uniref:Adenosylcobinamide kinase n=1 Tax=Marihabitans asiaticum TaxID=415218 RepID=A0A560WG83_9MICO|nr:bifunctional adenosylcobinamide kinase/adenosylcobinamide-phosphate guanylyltransferase [Marihabitans asiaticum]TWD16687.1 adenosylcobinamide kinase /adenosylcobinamide-phosphate guanylyltransferase [Marihabitans asiaticum]